MNIMKPNSLLEFENIDSVDKKWEQNKRSEGSFQRTQHLLCFIFPESFLCFIGEIYISFHLMILNASGEEAAVLIPSARVKIQIQLHIRIEKQLRCLVFFARLVSLLRCRRRCPLY